MMYIVWLLLYCLILLEAASDGLSAFAIKARSHRCRSFSLSAEDDDPDRLGVRVDGFPLPPLPMRDDDDHFLEQLKSRIPQAHTNNNNDIHRPLKSGAISKDRPLRIVIAGGGLGGLSLASHLLQLNDPVCPIFEVHILEQATQYKPFGGPIQIQSNALGALRRMNPRIYEAVRACGLPTGDRLSGIRDGIRHDEGWLVKFDAATPARRKRLPLTLAINRVVLQEIFLKYGVPPDLVLRTGCRVVSYENLAEHGVAVHLEDGETVHSDILVASDGIWSRVRHCMFGLPAEEAGPRFASKHARYSGYTCYTGTCEQTPQDIKEVAYKVFLGQRQYLGSTDAGFGWQHWWAFLPEKPGQTDDDEPPLEKLRREFADWSPEIHDLFDATDPSVVKRRDLYDRLPLSHWIDGGAVLLGDAAHPTMPNLGQGLYAILRVYLPFYVPRCLFGRSIPTALNAHFCNSHRWSNGD